MPRFKGIVLKTKLRKSLHSNHGSGTSFELAGMSYSTAQILKHPNTSASLLSKKSLNTTDDSVGHK